ncbi:FKBP-type peptidyl-prolyl cis-trans isomerase [Sesbania bispinosa]|nr:FKBP-type peptidyl-prolyl cis-trans isomerase [Sesbania bispinosa]
MKLRENAPIMPYLEATDDDTQNLSARKSRMECYGKLTESARQVIKGWDEELAHGEYGSPTIPPDGVVVLDECEGHLQGWGILKNIVTEGGNGIILRTWMECLV